MFAHLHTHTEYSMLDGLSRIDSLVERTKELGMDSLAITDHGGMYGAIDFYQHAKSEGIRPIIGCEMYVAHGSRHERNPNERSPFHMTVLAKNDIGYRNLVKLVTTSHLEGFYYRPRVDRDILKQHSDGLVVMSGCASGELPILLSQGRMDEARAVASWYREVFDDYYLEFMRHGDIPELPQINKGLLEVHRDLDIPLVATNDSHYVRKEDAPLQDILICIHTNTNIEDETRLRMEEDSYYLTSPQEMADLFADLPEAVANTRIVAEKCDLNIDFSQLRLPRFHVPGDMAPFEYLSKLCWDGLARRIPNAGDEEKDRLRYELEVIRQTSFDNYFLVVWDIARFVAERDILFAVRGSAAGSLTLYCLGVTDINPLPYRIVFERFLNLERKEMPDIDMDFQDDRREEVINYMVNKYGREHVAHIITFGTLGARAAIRDVGRALAVPYADVDRVARMIPTRLGTTLESAQKEPNSELAEAVSVDETIRNLVETAQGLEGVTRHSSTHAAGIVISEQPLDEVVPLQRPQKAGETSSLAMTTQYAMAPVAALGLLKMDFLGLVNLTVLDKARRLIANTRGIRFDLPDIPLDDANAFKLLSDGETVGIFQLEGSGMTRNIKELKPSAIGDVAAMIALYRPGPMEHISTFIDAKHGRSSVSYIHPQLQDILEDTYGVIVYQDQVLQIAQAVAGYTLGEADMFRKAMGKKMPEIMAQEKERFLSGARRQGFDGQLAQQVFSLIEPFAGYAFPKAHSVSYGLISYWTAYLKANYTPEYMVSLLNSFVGHSDRITSAVAECRRLNIPVLPPSLSRGQTDFTIELDEDGLPAVRFGMGAVKNVGSAAVNAVLESREDTGPFETIEQMCRDSDLGGLNRKTLECLVKVGALDEFGDRAALLESVDRILTLAQSEASLRNSNQSSMFDLFGESVPTPLAKIDLPDSQATSREKDEWEHELMGVSLSSMGALGSLIASADSEHVVFKSEIEPGLAGSKISLVGQIATVTRRFTRKNAPFIIANLALMDGQIEVFVWEEQIQSTGDLWVEGRMVTVAGTVRVREDHVSISCTAAEEFAPDAEAAETAQRRPTPPVPDAEPSPPPVQASDPEPSPPPVSDTEPSPPPVQASDIEPEPPAPPRQATPEIADEDIPYDAASVRANGASAPPTETPVPPVETAAPAVEDPAQAPTLAHSKVAVPQRLNLRLRQSDNAVDDQMMLDDVKRILLEYMGTDEVTLEIAADGHIYRMEWPPIRVHASDELAEKLTEVMGNSGSAILEAAAR